MTSLETLLAIRERDPDGDETRTSPPTRDDVDRFEKWIVDTYGHSALTAYYADVWEPLPDGWYLQ